MKELAEDHLGLVNWSLTHFAPNMDFALFLKSNIFISFSLSVKNSFQIAGPLTDILHFDLLDRDIGFI